MSANTQPSPPGRKRPAHALDRGRTITSWSTTACLDALSRTLLILPPAVGRQPSRRILTETIIRHALHRQRQPPGHPARHISRTLAGRHARIYPPFQHNTCAFSNISVAPSKSSICLDSQSTFGGNRPWQTTRMLQRSHPFEFSNETTQGLPANHLTAVYE